MRRFVSFGPAFVVLLTAGALLVAVPGLMMRASAVRTRERVTLARQAIAADDVLERLNLATRAVADSVEPSVVHLDVSIRRRSGASGSGWVFDDQGHIITNAHVVGPASRVTVQFFDGRVETGEVLGTDPLTDVAVLRVPPGDYLTPALRATGGRVYRGDRVFAFGSPFNFKFSMSEGIVSGLGRTARAPGGDAGITNFIQTDAAVNPGNSGGPLVDVRGRVVGMNVAIATADNSDGGTEGQSAGISFAIPLATIESRAEQIIAGKKPRGAYMGVVMAERAVRFGEGNDTGIGVLVRDVAPGTPAADAGLVAGDIIVQVDGEPVESMEVVRALVSARRPGAAVPIRVRRDDAFLDLRVVVGEMPDSVLAGQIGMLLRDTSGVVFDGAEGEPISVVALAPSGPAADAGFRQGDVLTHVKGTRVETFDAAMLALSESGLFRGIAIELTVQRLERDADAPADAAENPVLREHTIILRRAVP